MQSAVIDWADKKHDMCEQTLDYKGYQYSVISSSPKSIDEWSTLSAAKKARKSTLLSFFNQHKLRYPEANERRIEAIKEAVD